MPGLSRAEGRFEKGRQRLHSQMHARHHNPAVVAVEPVFLRLEAVAVQVLCLLQ